MRLLLLHISDFHFPGDGRNEAIERAGLLVQAALGEVPGVTAVLVVATGDFINRGDANGYEWADLFLNDLKSEVSSYASKPCYLGEVLLPGNHDLVSPADPAAAYAYRNALADVRSSDVVHPDQVQLAIALAAQDRFFEFARARDSMAHKTAEERLTWLQRFEISDFSVEVLAVNTSWMCGNVDDQGDLLAWLPDTMPAPGCAFRVAAMHHPFSWLHRENMRRVQPRISAFADLVLSGHEHAGQDFVRHSEGTGETLYFEGDAIGVPGIGKSGFAAIAVDFTTSARLATTFVWNGERYHVFKRSDAVPLRRGVGGARDGFQLDEAFEEELDDPGLLIGDQKTKIRLEDVFSYPRLRDITIEARQKQDTERKVAVPPQKREPGKNTPTGDKALTRRQDDSRHDPIINAIEALDATKENGQMLIVGDERSGKTTLLRRFYKDLRAMGMVPVLLRPQDLKRQDIDSIHKALKVRAGEQYGPNSSEAFAQLPPERRAILVDDLDAVPAGSAQLRELLGTLNKLACRVVLTSDELFILRQTWAAFGDEGMLDHKMYRLLPCDPPQRRSMALQLFKVMRPAEESPDSPGTGELLAMAERNLDAILGDKIVTPYPGEVKGILRELIDGQNQFAEYGAYGFFYDRLVKNDIAAGLSSLGRGELQPQAGVLHAVLSELAFRMFRLGHHAVTEAELSETLALLSKQKISYNREKLVQILKRSRMIVEAGGHYKFREKYQRYFFLATRMRDMLQQDDSRDEAREILLAMIDRMYEREAADVILFTIYLTHNNWLLEQVYQRATRVLSDLPPCDMDADFREALSGATVEIGDDGFEELSEDTTDSPESEVERDRRLTESIQRMNEAFNALNIIGQTVRNYPAMIDVHIREKMIEEGYRLALRALSAYLVLIKEGRSELDDLARRHLKLSTKQALPSFQVPNVNVISARLVGLCAFGVVRRAVVAMASPYLADSLEDVGRDSKSIGIRTMRAGILLDLNRFDSNDLRKLREEMTDNLLAMFVLKNVVISHLRTFRTIAAKREKLCSVVGVDPNAPAFFYSPDKPKRVGER